MPNKFSFIVNEITCLDYIRLHFISFIKLYNKNLDLSTKLGDVKKLLENENTEKNEMRRKIKKIIREVYNDDAYLQIILQLCKLHIKCLFNLAKNRNQEVCKNFLQMGIVDFMIKEIDLEHEAAEKIYRFKTHIIGDGDAYVESNVKNIIESNSKNNIGENLFEKEKNNLKEISIKKDTGNLKDKFSLIGNLEKEKSYVKINEDLKQDKNKECNTDNSVIKKIQENPYEQKYQENTLSDEISDNLSNYSDLSLDLIDRERIINTNIKLNKNLDLNNLINKYPVNNCNNNDTNKDNFKEKEKNTEKNNFKQEDKKQIVSILGEKEIKNINLNLNSNNNSKMNIKETYIEDNKWSFKDISFEKISEKNNKISEKNDNIIEYLETSNFNKNINRLDNNYIETEKSGLNFNYSYLDNNKIKFDNINSTSNILKNKEEEQKVFNKSPEKSKENNNSSDDNCYDDLESKKIEIIVNPGYDKSKIPIKLNKCKIYYLLKFYLLF